VFEKNIYQRGDGEKGDAMPSKEQLGTKVTTTKQAQDLKTLKLEDFIGILLTLKNSFAGRK